MTPETDLDLLSWTPLPNFKGLEERRVKDVETTIEPLVELAHKMNDLKLTRHEISQYITNNMSSFHCWLPYTDLQRFSVAIKRDMKWIEQRSNHLYASSFLRYVLTALTSSSILLVFKGFLQRYKYEIWDGVLPSSEHSQEAITVAVAAVLHLLAFVFQYLIGYTDRGGTKTYSSGSLDFRESFISLLLFHGAYVWIKFRQPASGKRKAVSSQSRDDRSKVYARASKINGSPTKYEARYNIPTDSLDEHHPVKCPRLSLGLYKSDVEARFVSRVARSFYEVDQGEACCVEIQGVHHKFSVPAISEQERELEGEEKRQWVISKAKQVGKQKYAEFRKEQLAKATDTGSSDPSPSPSLTCQPSPMRARSADEPLIAFDAPSWPGPVRSPCEETFRSFEGPVISEGVEPQWFGESLPFSNFTCGFSDEDVEAMCEELGFHSAPQQKSTLDMSSPCSDFAQILENDSLPLFEAQPEAVGHAQVWSVQNLQQLRGAGDAAVPCADGTGSEPIGVLEQNQLVLYQVQQQSQVLPVQSYEAVQPQVSEFQILETPQHISDRVEEKEPSESIILPYECLLKDNKCLREEIKRLQKEKERSDREKERLKSIIKQLLH